METKHTKEPWMVGGDMAMKHTHCTQIIGTIDGEPFILASMNYNFPEPAIRNCVRAVQCVNALAGIPDPAKYTQSVERLVEAAKNAVPMMQMAWQQYGVGGMFECMDALRSALADMEQGGANAQ